MKKSMLIQQLIRKNKGYIKTSEIIELHISKTYFAAYRRENNLVKASQGLYRTQDAWQDDMYILQIRYQDAIFSHSTSAYLHGISDREPSELSITLQEGKGSARLNKDGVQVYKVKVENFEVGLTEGFSPSGHMIRIYNMERTICDLVRSRNKLDNQEVQSAIKEYLLRRDRNIPRLMRYSKLFSIEKILKLYTEVLL